MPGGRLVRNWQGRAETAGHYADFTLQLEAFVNGRRLNSANFCCIPGEFQNGYESQIHNGYQEGDRTRPTDCGTGGIFRRQNALVVGWPTISPGSTRPSTSTARTWPSGSTAIR